MTDQGVINDLSMINVTRLGIYLDGWAEIIEDMGEKAPEVQNEVLKRLIERDMPDTKLELKTGCVSKFWGEKRDYVVAEIDPGVNTLISVNKHGKDLFVAWRTWIAPRVNFTLLMWVGLVALFAGIFAGGINKSTNFFTGEVTIHFSIWGSVAFAVGTFLGEIILICFWGKLYTGRFMTYIFKQVNVYDADDISALSLSVHHFLLRALDNIGIDISQLRIKQKFSNGRRGEEL